MRRLLLLALASSLLACGGDSILPPVLTVDGQWIGTQNGLSMSFNLIQVDSTVGGSTVLAGALGSSSGTVTGTFDYPKVHLLLDVPGYETVTYDGTMSTTQAKIFGTLNGSGFTNVEVDVHKN